MVAQTQWHKLDRDRTVAMIESVKTTGDHILFSIATSEAKCAKLPFYKNLLIYRLTNYSSLPSFAFDYIGDGKTYHYMDGSAVPVYTANDSGHLFLTPQNLLDYIIFFFTHVSGPDGDVFVIEDPRDHPALDALDITQKNNIAASHQAAEISADGRGNFIAQTTLFYMGSLVRATVQVDRGGRVNVTDYQMLLTPTSGLYEGSARMTTPDSPFGNLQDTFGQGAAKTGMDYTHAQEDKFRTMLREQLAQSPTGAALLQYAAQQRIIIRIIKGKNSSGFIPESRAIFMGIPPELSTVSAESVLSLAAYLRQAQLQLLGHKNPDESMGSHDKAVAFDSKMLDSIVTMCKIAIEQYETGHTEFVDALLKMGHGEVYEAYKKQVTSSELVNLFYKIYVQTG